MSEALVWGYHFFIFSWDRRDTSDMLEHGLSTILMGFWKIL